MPVERAKELQNTVPHFGSLLFAQKISGMDKKHSKEAAGKKKFLNEAAARRKMRYEESKYQTPIPMRTYGVEPAPPVVAIFGPKGSGKTVFLDSLVKWYTKQNVREIRGTVTLMVSKTKRLTLLECPSTLSAMVDTAKIADLLIFLVDASVGFEIETFEMLSLLKTHGFPKVLCVVTKLDSHAEERKQREVLRKIKKRMWTEICDGIKILQMTKIVRDRYLDRDVSRATRHITQMKYRPILWRSTHPFVLADQLEVLTAKKALNDPEKQHPQKITVSDSSKLVEYALTGYVRGGIALKINTSFHLPGIGDYRAERIEVLPDPCPLLNAQKKKLSERKKPLFAPMSDIRGMLVEQSAVYIDVPNAPVVAPGVPDYSLPNQNIPFFSRSDLTLNIGDATKEQSTKKAGEKEKNQGPTAANSPDKAQTPSGTIEELSESDSDSDALSMDSLDEEAVRRMFEEQKETEEDFAQDFSEKYNEEEENKADLFSMEKEKIKEIEETNKSITEAHTEQEKIHIQGIPPGKYVKLVMRLPEALKDIYSPHNPLLLGANREEELSLTYIQGRVKRHRWYKKTLKTKEAHYVSMGWRRFQTVPVFSVKDPVRNRMLKYIPESMACSISFFGPVHPPGTSFCLLRKFENENNFCIAATGIETEVGDKVKIMKKLKLVGYPKEIKKHTVFVKDMFHSTEEAARYEGTLLKSVSGLRGQIKKAGETGIFRATFEGEMKMSDIVFMPCFFPIEPPRIYLNAEIFRDAGEIRLLKEIRDEKNMHVSENHNSEYRDVEEPKLSKLPPIPRKILAAAPLSMLAKHDPEAKKTQMQPLISETPEEKIKRQTLEAISQKAAEIKQKAKMDREKRIQEVLDARKENRKQLEDKMKEKAAEKRRLVASRKGAAQKQNKKHKKKRKA